MAMIICKACGKSYSQHAAACIGCGEPNHYQTRKNKPGEATDSPIKIALFIVIAVVFTFIMLRGDDTPAPAQNTAQDPRVLRAMALAHALKLNMRDPDSFKVNIALASADGQTICLQYQARNGFGGMNQENFVTTAGATQALEWNDYCLGSNMTDITSRLE